MCWRFFRDEVGWEDCHAYLSLIRPKEIPGMSAACNVAPTQTAPIIRQGEEGDGLELTLAEWGRPVPCLWKKPVSERKFATFNARNEEAAGKASFRAAWKKRPCLVPMSGYLEWKGAKGKKQPYAIALRNRRWFFVCGLWDSAFIEDAPLDSFTI